MIYCRYDGYVRTGNTQLILCQFIFFFLVDRHTERTVEVCEDLPTRRYCIDVFLFHSIYRSKFPFLHCLYILTQYEIIFKKEFDSDSTFMYSKLHAIATIYSYSAICFYNAGIIEICDVIFIEFSTTFLSV